MPLSVLVEADCFALRLADEIAGIVNAARAAMIATTTNNSTNVKA
jgi:hypothetical protein